MDVRRIEEEFDPDFLLDAHSRTSPAESVDSCKSKGLESSSFSLSSWNFILICVVLMEHHVRIVWDLLCDSKIPFRLSVVDTSKSVGTVVVILKLVRLLDISFGYLILSLASPVCTILKRCDEDLTNLAKVCDLTYGAQCSHLLSLSMCLIEDEDFVKRLRSTYTFWSQYEFGVTWIRAYRIEDVHALFQGKGKQLAVYKGSFVSFREMITSQLQGKLWLYDEVRRDDGWSYLGVVIARPSTIWERANIVVDAWSKKGGVETSKAENASKEILHGLDYQMEKRDGVARHGVHVSSIPDKDGMYIEVLERDVEELRNTSRYEYCLPSID
ncbi:hypothetical protein Tco_0014730 [Tanacetum coccineum]